jgi:hypothetical protein
VALRISREVRREVLGPVLSRFGSVAMITLVGWICREYSSLVWRCMVRRLFQSCSPNFRGTFFWRALLTALDASRMLVAMALSWCRDGRRSNSSPGMLLASLRMRKVGSLSGLDSSASYGKWLNWDSRRYT